MQLQWPQGRRTIVVTRSSVSHPSEIASLLGNLVRAHREISLGTVATMTGLRVSELAGAVAALESRGGCCVLSALEREQLSERPAAVVLRAVPALQS